MCIQSRAGFRGENPLSQLEPRQFLRAQALRCAALSQSSPSRMSRPGYSSIDIGLRNRLMLWSPLARNGWCLPGSIRRAVPLEAKESSKIAMMAKRPASLHDSRRELVTDPREIPRRFKSRAEEAAFWESHDFAPGVLTDGESVRKEIDRLLGLRNKQ